MLLTGMTIVCQQAMLTIKTILWLQTLAKVDVANEKGKVVVT